MQQQMSECALVALEVSIPTPGRKASKADFKKAAPDLPPEAISTMGAFRIFNPKAIAPLYNLKREAERAIAKVGIRFGKMGRVIAPDDIEAVEAELNDIRDRFFAKKAEIMADFARQQEAWIEQFPEWEDILRKKMGSPDEIGDKIGFRYQMMKIQPAGTGDADTEETITGLSGQLLEEIHQDASELMENSFIGRERVTRKALRPIKEMREKVNRLIFISPKAMILRDTIDRVLNACPPPSEGRLTEEQTDRIRSALHLIADKSALTTHIERVFEARRNGTVSVEDEEDSDEAPSPDDEPVFSGESADPVEEADSVEITEEADDTAAPNPPEPERPAVPIF